MSDGQPRYAPHLAALLRERDDYREKWEAATAEIARLQKATVGDCASCGRGNMIVYFDREALVCADFDDCWAACEAARRGAAGEGEAE